MRTYLYRAVDQHTQVIDVLVTNRRDAAAARAFFARAQRLGPDPVEVTSDRAPVHPRVIDELVPTARHVFEQYRNNIVEADHGRLKARLRPMRGLKSVKSLRTIAAGHAFVQNLRRGHYELTADLCPQDRLRVAFVSLQHCTDHKQPPTRSALTLIDQRNSAARHTQTQAQTPVNLAQEAGDARGRRPRMGCASIRGRYPDRPCRYRASPTRTGESMVDHAGHRNVEVTVGERVVASAQVDTSPEDPDTVRASLHAESGHLPVGSRASLVDAVVDLPELQGIAHVEATIPLGDAESLQRLRERTDHMTTRAAGSSALVDADMPDDQ